jgi:hypothetical protein
MTRFPLATTAGHRDPAWFAQWWALPLSAAERGRLSAAVEIGLAASPGCPTSGMTLGLESFLPERLGEDRAAGLYLLRVPATLVRAGEPLRLSVWLPTRLSTDERYFAVRPTPASAEARRALGPAGARARSKASAGSWTRPATIIPGTPARGRLRWCIELLQPPRVADVERRAERHRHLPA